MKIRVFDPAITAEIANSTPEEITISSSSGSPPQPPNSAPNSTDVSVSDDGSNAEYAEGGFVLNFQPLEEIINEEEEGEINLENVSEMMTPCNIPSTSAKQQGDRSSIVIGQRLAKSMHTKIYNDVTLEHVTRVLFSTEEPYNDDVQNAFASLTLEDEIAKSNNTDNSTKNPSPAGKQNQTE